MLHILRVVVVKFWGNQVHLRNQSGRCPVLASLDASLETRLWMLWLPWARAGLHDCRAHVGRRAPWQCWRHVLYYPLFLDLLPASSCMMISEASQRSQFSRSGKIFCDNSSERVSGFRVLWAAVGHWRQCHASTLDRFSFSMPHPSLHRK